MEKRLFLTFLMLSILISQVGAQIAYNTHSSTPAHAKTIAAKGHKKTKVRKARSEMVTEFRDVNNVPDSIQKKATLASKRIANLFVTSLGKKPCDSTYDMHTWTSYKSKVLGTTAQVRIDMKCALASNPKSPRKPPVTRYIITYQADVNIFKIVHDSYAKKTKVYYNESHWPGFMHSDKTPTQADLNKDISAFLDRVINDEIVLH